MTNLCLHFIHCIALSYPTQLPPSHEYFHVYLFIKMANNGSYTLQLNYKNMALKTKHLATHR